MIVRLAYGSNLHICTKKKTGDLKPGYGVLMCRQLIPVLTVVKIKWSVIGPFDQVQSFFCFFVCLVSFCCVLLLFLTFFFYLDNLECMV